MKKRLVASLLASTMLAASIPFPALAEETYQYDLIVELSGAELADGYFDPGDVVDVTVSIANAGWSKPETGSGLIGAQFRLDFDKELFTWVKNEKGKIYTVGETFQDYSPSENSDTGDYQLFYLSDDLDAVPALSDDKITITTCKLQVVSPAPAKAGRVSVGLNMERQPPLFGSILTEEYVDAVPNVIEGSALVDTVAPVIQLEGTAASEEEVFYYQPVTVSVTDDSSITWTLDGAPWEGQSLTVGGTLCATDARGNSTTVQVTIDAAAFNQAVDAAEQIPETVDYKSISLIQEAQKAIEAVTDSAASEKLAAQKQKVQDALEKWNAIDAQVTAVEDLIAALPADVKPADAAKLDEIQKKIDELKDLGVETSDIENYSVYSTAVDNLAGALAEIQAVRDQIKALPVAEDVNFADAAAIGAAEKAAKDLQSKYGEEVLSAEDLAPLVAAQAKLSELNDARKALVEEIANAQLSITTAQEDQDAIQALRDKVTELEALETSFTADELKNLVDAEKAMAELLKQSEEAHAALAKLPAQDEVLYTDKAAIDAVQKMVKDLEGKDTFTEEEQAKLAAAQAGYQDILDGIAQVESDIAALPDEVTPDQLNVILQIQHAISALAERKVPTDVIKGYEKYQAAADALEGILAEIQAVRDQVNALPAKEKVCFTDEANIENAAKAVKALQEKYGADVLTEKELAPLAAAQEGLTELKAERAQLVQDIANAELPVTLKQEDVERIEALRKRVKALEARKAEFTQEELLVLTNAEKALEQLKERSSDAHKALDSLPGRDAILYTDNVKLEQLIHEMNELEALGDTFTAEEKAKVEAAQAGLKDLDERLAALADRMAAVDGEVIYSDISLLSSIDQEKAALQARGCPIDENTVGKEALDHYAAFAAAISAMKKELADLNQDMEDALDHWSYNNESAFDAIRVKMDAAAQKYQMTGDQKKAVFAQYSESQDRNAEVKKLLDEAKQEINDLPKDITLDQSKDVAAITNLLDKLMKEYGLTNKVLETELGTAYTTYKNAVSKLEDLKEEKPDSQEPSGGQTANGGSGPQSTQAPAAAQGTSPSTGDSFNLLAMAGVFMTAAIGWIVLKIGIRRRED